MKKVISVILSFILLFSMMAVPSVSAAADVSDGNYYRFEISGGKAALVEAEISHGDAVIPSEYNGYPVTTIGFGVLGTYNLTSVVLPETITTINAAAFSGSGITQINIPASVNSIASSAFSSCKYLTAINVSSDNNYYTSIDGVLYSKDKTELIAYPAGKGSKRFTIPNTVQKIHIGAFCECSTIGTVTIPNSVTEIGAEAFYNCRGLETVNLLGSITAIEARTFYYCDNLASIVIPEGVKTVGEGAFNTCTSLASVSIPSTIESIGKNAFYKCVDLQSITVAEGNEKFGTANGSLVNKESKTLILYPLGSTATDYTVADGIEIIGDYAFSHSKSLESVTIPNGVKTIHASFYYCKNLKSVSFPFGITEIEPLTFYNSGIRSVVIPHSVTKIGESAFGSCYSLKDVYYEGTAEDWLLVTKGENYIPTYATSVYFIGKHLEGASAYGLDFSDDAVKFNAAKLNNSDVTVNASGDAAGYDFSNANIYALSLTMYDESYNPEFPLSFSIPVPDRFDSENCKVFSIGSDGTAVDTNAIYFNGEMRFDANGAGIYALAATGTVDLPAVVTDKELYEIDEPIVLTVRTSSDVQKIALYNEVGKGITRKSTDYIDTEDGRVWTVVTSVGSKGDRTIYIKAMTTDQEATDTDVFAEVSFKVLKQVISEDEVPSIFINSISCPRSVKANEKFTITFNSSRTVQAIGVFNENGSGVSAKKSYSDSGKVRTWTVELSVSSRGYRGLNIKIKNDDGSWIDQRAFVNFTVLK